MTSTTIGKVCEFTFQDGSRCVFGLNHRVGYHHSSTGLNQEYSTNQTTQSREWTHRLVNGWWCVYLSTGELGAKFIREGDALTYIDLAHRGIHPQYCASCTVPLKEETRK